MFNKNYFEIDQGKREHRGRQWDQDRFLDPGLGPGSTFEIRDLTSHITQIYFSNWDHNYFLILSERVAKGFINSSLKACLYYWFGARVGLSFYHKEMWGVISVRKYSSQPLSPASRDSPQKFHFLNKRWRYPLHQGRLQLSRLITILSLLNP